MGDCELILIDNRACGRSINPTQPLDILDLAVDTAAVLDHLGVVSAVVVGHSMGGAIGQTLTVQRPELVARLVLLNFARVSTGPVVAFDAVHRLMLAGVGLPEIVCTLVPWIYSDDFLSQPQMVEQLIAASAAAEYPQPYSGFGLQGEALRRFDSRAWLPRVTQPALVIGAEHDLVAPPRRARELRDGLPNSELVMIGGGHGSHTEAPALVAELVREFATRP